MPGARQPPRAAHLPARPRVSLASCLASLSSSRLPLATVPSRLTASCSPSSDESLLSLSLSESCARVSRGGWGGGGGGAGAMGWCCARPKGGASADGRASLSGRQAGQGKVRAAARKACRPGTERARGLQPGLAGATHVVYLLHGALVGRLPVLEVPVPAALGAHLRARRRPWWREGLLGVGCVLCGPGSSPPSCPPSSRPRWRWRCRPCSCPGPGPSPSPFC
jgi:hypothetical protein